MPDIALATPTITGCSGFADPWSSNAACSDMCTWDGGNARLKCDLSVVCNTTSNNTLEVISAPSGGPYFGARAFCDSLGTPVEICCGVTDNQGPGGDEEVEQVYAYGTGNRDKIMFQSGSERLGFFSGGLNISAHAFGGDGDDIMIGSFFTTAGYTETLEGQDGMDVLFAEAGGASLYGGDDDDYCDGGPDPDVLDGGGDDDLLVGRGETDAHYGGTGDDRACGDEATLGGTPGTLTSLSTTMTSPSGWTVTCDDATAGNEAGDWFNMGTGDDFASGNTGADVLCDPGDSTTTLVGGVGDDDLHVTLANGLNVALDGGDDNDRCTYGTGIALSSCSMTWTVPDTCPAAP